MHRQADKLRDTTKEEKRCPFQWVRGEGGDAAATNEARAAAADAAARSAPYGYAPHAYRPQFARLERCFIGAKRWGEAHGRSFTHYIRARPDAEWGAPMPALSTLEPGAVSLRARYLKANFSLTVDAMSWKNVCRNHCDQETEPGVACISPDDQVWKATRPPPRIISPASAAPSPSYTSHCPAVPPQSHHSPTTVPPSHPPRTTIAPTVAPTCTRTTQFAVVPVALAATYFAAAPPPAEYVPPPADGRVIHMSMGVSRGCGACYHGRRREHSGEMMLASHLGAHEAPVAVSVSPFRFRLYRDVTRPEWVEKHGVHFKMKAGDAAMQYCGYWTKGPKSFHNGKRRKEKDGGSTARSGGDIAEPSPERARRIAVRPLQ